MQKKQSKKKPEPARKRVGFEDWDMENAIQGRMRRLVNMDDIGAFVERVVIVVFIVVLLFGVIFGVYPVDNDNMSPRISAGDVVFYSRWDKDPAAHEVCIYKAGQRTRVGRVVARPGDEISIQGGKVIVNGFASYEEKIYYTTPDYGRLSYPMTLGKDEYFILADYRKGARDSRYFGPISKKKIKGKVYAVIRWMNI